MRIVKEKQRHSHKGVDKIQYRLAFVGTAWCITSDKYLLTAYHIFNNGAKRDESDKYLAFTVPNNESNAYAFPIINFPVEDPNCDIAVVEVGPSQAPKQHISSVPISFSIPRDGAQVLTMGFPSPDIEEAKLDQSGSILIGGKFFLKSHANTGIIAAQYRIDNQLFYEFNVGWHHGESGGPVFSIDPFAGFAIMQHYRNVKTPHGIFPGPHRGRSLHNQEENIRKLGENIL